MTLIVGRLCRKCGLAFVPKNGSQRYCAPCADDRSGRVIARTPRFPAPIPGGEPVAILFGKPSRRRDRVSERDPLYEDQLYAQIEGLEPRPLLPFRQWRVRADRKWAFDFAWPALKLAVEVDGGTWIKGRHSFGTGLENDYRKLNAACLDGWRVVRVTGGMVESGEALALVTDALTAFGGGSR